MREPKIWLIADTHFGHENVIKYENRPFTNKDEMDKVLIDNWNSSVGKQDTVYMLGDFTLSGNKEYIKSIVEKLNGKIILIMGNHDRLKPYQYVQAGFYSAIRKPIMLDNRTVLMHEPPEPEDILDGLTYVFGHIHSKPMRHSLYGKSVCVSVERINYTPIELSKAIDSIQMQNRFNR